VTAKKVFRESDLDTSLLDNKQIGVIGYGSQGRAQALNLRDSGFSPLVGVRQGRSFEKALADGVSPLGVEEVAGRCDIVMVLAPDEVQAGLCNAEIFPHLSEGAFLGFATGFNVHFGLVSVPGKIKVFLTAPKGPGHILRKRFEEGGGIPALVASLNEDRDGLLVAMAYAKAIGCARSGVIQSTFREEAIADLFGEQCVLSGGLVELMKAAFDVLVARGYSPEVAYIECISEVEYMATLIARVGFAGLRANISSTAYFGGLTRGRRIIDNDARRKLDGILDEIEEGRFTEEFRQYILSGKQGLPPEMNLSTLERARSNLKVS
jgi:ketol-acid reductoisomerase